MDSTRLLDILPLWVLFLITLSLVLVAIEIGHKLGDLRRQRSAGEKDAPVAAIVAAALGLLAFLLAFTFGVAASRYDARRMVVLEESNAIGTCYLRAGMLPEPNRTEIRKLLQEYVEARLQGVQPRTVDEAISKSVELQNALWEQATQVAAKDTHSIVTGVFIQSLNEVIDLHSKRVLLAIHNRIPGMVWISLYLISLLAMVTLGYQQGMSGSRRSFAVLPLAVAFSAVVLLIAGLDRPQDNLLSVSQRSMIDLQKSMSQPDSKAKPPGP